MAGQRGHFGIDELTRGGMGSGATTAEDAAKTSDNEDELDGMNVEDDEELQGKLLSSFTARARARRDAQDEESVVEFSESEDSQNDSDNEDG